MVRPLGASHALRAPRRTPLVTVRPVRGRGSQTNTRRSVDCALLEQIRFCPRAQWSARSQPPVCALTATATARALQSCRAQRRRGAARTAAALSTPSETARRRSSARTATDAATRSTSVGTEVCSCGRYPPPPPPHLRRWIPLRKVRHSRHECSLGNFCESGLIFAQGWGSAMKAKTKATYTRLMNITVLLTWKAHVAEGFQISADGASGRLTPVLQRLNRRHRPDVSSFSCRFRFCVPENTKSGLEGYPYPSLLRRPRNQQRYCVCARAHHTHCEGQRHMWRHVALFPTKEHTFLHKRLENIPHIGVRHGCPLGDGVGGTGVSVCVSGGLGAGGLFTTGCSPVPQGPGVSSWPCHTTHIVGGGHSGLLALAVVEWAPWRQSGSCGTPGPKIDRTGGSRSDIRWAHRPRGTFVRVYKSSGDDQGRMLQEWL